MYCQDAFCDHYPAYCDTEKTGTSIFRKNLRRSVGAHPEGPIYTPTSALFDPPCPVKYRANRSQGLGNGPPESLYKIASEASRTFVPPPSDFLRQASCKIIKLFTPPIEKMPSDTESKDAFSGDTIEHRFPVEFDFPVSTEAERCQGAQAEQKTSVKSLPCVDRRRMQHIWSTTFPVLKHLPATSDFHALQTKFQAEIPRIAESFADTRRASGYRIARGVVANMIADTAVCPFDSNTTYGTEYPGERSDRPPIAPSRNNRMKDVVQYDGTTIYQTSYDHGFNGPWKTCSHELREALANEHRHMRNRSLGPAFLPLVLPSYNQIVGGNTVADPTDCSTTCRNFG